MRFWREYRATEIPSTYFLELFVAKKLDYNALIKKASISIVKEILTQISTEGLYKKQHIYITFSLNHPGVKISKLLRDDFDDEMTIVLQYEFWDLAIDDYGFSVSLAFEHSDETLYIPFSSLISVSDPSEDFCLDFNPDFSELPAQETVDVSDNDSGTNIISFSKFKKDKD